MNNQSVSVRPGIGQVSVVSKPGRKYWQTSNARSFRCLLVHDVRLTDASNHTAILHFDEVRVQAFNHDPTFRTREWFSFSL